MAMFYEGYYLAQNPDVAKAVESGAFGTGWEHYKAFGQSEGRAMDAPAAYGDFNEEYYLANNADVAKAVDAGAFGTGWEHYSRFGQGEERSTAAPTGYGDFNEEYYLAGNADVARAVETGAFGTGWEHYSRFGQDEGRSTAAPDGYADFNEHCYLANNPDVAKAVDAGSFGTGWEHYSLFGQTEERSFSAPVSGGDEHQPTEFPPAVVTPTFTLTASADSVDEGATATFNLATTNVAEGTELAYTLSGAGVDESDIVGGVLTGVATVGADGSAAIEVALAADTTTEGLETLSVALDNGEATATADIIDTSLDPVPEYTLTPAAPSVDEGATATFNLATTNVDEGTALAYTLSGTGVDESDIVGGALTGVATVDVDGNAVIEVGIAADTTTEGLETLSVALDNGEATATADINDTSLDPSTPTYTLTPAAPSVDEGATATFTLTTTNVDEGTALAYTLSGTGIDAADIVDGVLTGEAIVGADGTAAIDVALAADGTPEGEETLTLALDGQDASAAVIVNDTSTEAPAVNIIESTQADETLEGTAGVDNFVYDYASQAEVLDGIELEAAGRGLDGTDTVLNFALGTDMLTFNDSSAVLTDAASMDALGIYADTSPNSGIRFYFNQSNGSIDTLTVEGALDNIQPEQYTYLTDADGTQMTTSQAIEIIGVDSVTFTTDAA